MKQNYYFRYIFVIFSCLLLLSTQSVFADSVIYACVANASGATRIVTPTTVCAVGETKKSWNNLTPVNTFGASSGNATTFIKIASVSINGGNDQAHVAPGASFTVALDYSIKDTACASCFDQIEIGLASGKPQSCVYDDVPGLGGQTANGSVTLTAPAVPGIYYIAYDKAQQFNCANAIALNKWSSFVGAPGLRNYIGAISVY